MQLPIFALVEKMKEILAERSYIKSFYVRSIARDGEGDRGDIQE